MGIGLLNTHSDMFFLPQAESLRQMGLESFMECLIMDLKRGGSAISSLGYFAPHGVETSLWQGYVTNLVGACSLIRMRRLSH